jgi:predicted SnoaL-like aldol condensation-catalyzing enzyme
MMNTRKSKVNYLPFLVGIVCAIGLASCSKKVIYTAPSSLSQEYVSKLSDEKQMAYRFVTAPKSDNLIDALLSDSFYSHDQDWDGEKETFIGKRNTDSSFTQMKPVRVIQDDALIAVHSRMLGDTLRFRWDILRIEHQKIQEHWSNVNDSLHLNPDKHSEIDGPTIPVQLENTDTNRALITRFIDQCMIREDGGAAKFFNFGLYIQHNRDVGDGLNGLLWAMLKMKRQGHIIKFKHNYHIIAEGNFVLSATEGYVGDEKTVFYDFFRIEENKIVEHWDIIAPVDNFLYFQPSEKQTLKEQ